MAPDSIIFAMANPDPEIHPDVARRHARVVATGRSDFPNQINNVLAFPGVFRGALDVRATAITDHMKLAAARALCDVVGDDVSEEYVIPSVVRPAGRSGGGGRGRRSRAGRRRRPPLTGAFSRPAAPPSARATRSRPSRAGPSR